MLPAEKLDQIIDAIVDGKYSWACVLLLRTHGLNPLYYIPYRTYNRLSKENKQVKKQPVLQPEKMAQAILNSGIAHLHEKQQQKVAVINDLPHMESASHSKVLGGERSYYLLGIDGGLALSN
ncbi:MAG: HetP family heterocyst commitment protein [Kovacikia sp.]